MAYDPIKAHEYYMKYRKKGLLKGRKRKALTSTSSKKGGKKKGSKKKTEKKTSLVGLSTSGLNEAGAMKWALAKERLTNEMNTAMAQAKTPEEKDKIRQEYQNKALAELQAIKNDPSTAKAKTTKAKSTGSSKSSGNSKSKNNSDSNSGSDDSGSTSVSSSKSKKKDVIIKQASKAISGIAEGGGSFTSKTGNKIKTEAIKAEYEEQKNEIQRQIFKLRQEFDNMSPERKIKLKKEIKQKISDLKKRLKETKDTTDIKLRSL